MTNQPAKSDLGSSFMALLIGAVIVIAAVVIYNIGSKNSKQTGPLTEGKPFPELQAEGWLNGDAPTAKDLEGKVLVVDAFAFWCGPCRRAVPEMVALHEKYESKGALFINLTGEGSDSLDKTKQFLTSTGITWLCGYGVNDTLVKLENQFIPQVWVVNRKGNIVWDSSKNRGSLDSVLKQALAEK